MVLKKQNVLDLIFLPLRFLLPHEFLPKIGLTSLREERLQKVLSCCEGKLLDIGCGEKNKLVRSYRNSNNCGIGLDIYAWEGVDVISDSQSLPFKEGTFDTITLAAILNHIIDSKKALEESYRVLKNGGYILITMISPIVGIFRHKLIAWWDKDQNERGMKKGEKYGISQREMVNLLKRTGFREIKKENFLFNMNNIYIARKGSCKL